MATSMSAELSEAEGVTFGDLVYMNKHSLWDPQLSTDWDVVKPTEQCFLRVKRDIMSVYKDPTPGMCIVPDMDDITKLHALITGPFDTPYEGGFFYFVIRCPPDYPIKPPRVKLMTTGDGCVRFNPNLYKNGKVCLSILGTWSGPGWSPANSISSVLISIQSLMNEKPYHNEPGFENERQSGDAKRYNEIIQHETLRVAVCDMVENKDSCPQALREVMEASFGNFYEYYVSTCKNNMHMNTQPMQDPFGEKRGSFNYKSILEKLEKLKTKYSLVESDNGSDLESTSGESDNELNEDNTNSSTTTSRTSHSGSQQNTLHGARLPSSNHTAKDCSSCDSLSESTISEGCAGKECSGQDILSGDLSDNKSDGYACIDSFKSDNKEHFLPPMANQENNSVKDNNSNASLTLLLNDEECKVNATDSQYKDETVSGASNETENKQTEAQENSFVTICLTG